MRLICIIFTVFFSQSANAQIKEVRLKTLLSICETAQSTNDLVTIKNIAKTANAAAKERITLSSERFPNVFLTREDSFNLRISVFLAFIFSCPLGGS